MATKAENLAALDEALGDDGHPFTDADSAADIADAVKSITAALDEAFGDDEHPTVSHVVQYRDGKGDIYTVTRNQWEKLYSHRGYELTSPEED